MASGLQALFGLDDPQQDFPNELSKKFSVTFKKEMKVAADATAFTVKNGEEKAHDGLVRRGETVYGDYRDTQKQIETNGEEGAVKKQIKDVLDTTKTLAGDAEKLRAAIAAAKQAWEAKAAEKSAADGQIDELDQWGHKNAAKLLQVRQKIDGDAGARRWEAATKTVEALTPKLKPIYEELQKQKQAKTDYDNQRPAFDKDFAEAESYPDATDKIKGQASEIRGKLDEVDAKAEERDYIAACELLSALDGLLVPLKEAIEEHKRLKAEYEALLKELEPRIAKTDPPIPGETAQKVAASIANNLSEAKASADAGEYEKALDSLGLIKDSLAGYEELVAQHEARKAEYEKRLGDMKPRLEKAAEAVKEESLKELQGKLLARRDEMEQAASKEDYETSLEHTDYLEAALETYESGIEELERKREEYAQRLKELEPRIAKTDPPIPGDRAQKVAASIASNLSEAKASAEQEDFPSALTSLEVIDDALAGYEELVAQHEARKAEYEKQAEAFKPRLEKAAEEVASETLKDFQAVLKEKQQEMEQAAVAEDYEQALAKADELDGALTSYESALAEYKKKFEEYKKRVAELDPRIEKISPPIPGERAKKVSDSIVKEREDAKALSDAGDYDEALAKLEIAEHSLAGYEELVEQHEARKAEYEARLEKLKPRLETASGATIKKESLKGLQEKVTAASDEMTKAAEGEDYEKALERADYLEAALETFEAGLVELEAERKAYAARLKELEPRAAKASPPIPGEAAAGVSASIAGNMAAAKEQADLEEFDAALDILETVAESLAGYEKLVEQHEARKAEYKARFEKLKPRLETAAGATIKKESLKGLQEKVSAASDEMTKAAEGEDYVKALERADYLEAALETFEAGLAELEAERKAYEARIKELEPRAAKSSPPIPGEAAAGVSASIAGNMAAAKEQADLEEFDAALDILETVAESLAGYEKLVEQYEARKAEYKTRSEKLKPRLEKAAAEVKGEILKQQQEIIAGVSDDMAAAADKEDYETALGHVEILETELTGYEALIKDLEEQKKAYEARVKAIQASLDKASEEVESDALKPLHEKIVAKRGEMETAAEDHDFKAALTVLDWMEPALDDFEAAQKALEEAEKEYKERLSELQPRLDKLAEPEGPDAIKKLHGEITATRSKMEQAAGAGDYEKALGLIILLEADVSGYEVLIKKQHEQKKAFEERLKKLQPRFEKSEKESKNEGIQQIQTNIARNKGDMEKLVEQADYDGALTKLDLLEAQFDAFDSWLAQLEAKKAEYEARFEKLKPRLETASGATIKKESLKGLQEKVSAASDEMTKAAEGEDCEKALERADYLEAALETFEAGLAELEAERKAYAARLKELEPRAAKASPPIPGEAAAGVSASIAGNMAAAKEQADLEEFDAALDILETVAESLAGYEKLVEQHEARKAEYKARLEKLQPRLETASGATIKKESLKGLQEKVTAASDEMTKAAEGEDYVKALERADYLQAALETFEAGLAELEAERKAYAARLKELEPRAAKASPPIPGEAAAGVSASIAGNLAAAKEKADLEEFDAALDILETVAESLAGYEKLVEQYEAKKEEYEKRLTALNPRLVKATQEVNSEALQRFQAVLVGRREEMDEGAAQGDYDEALARMDVLEAALKSYESAHAAHQKKFEAYKKRLAELDPRIEKVTPPIPGARAQKVSASIVETRKAAQTASDKGDYDEAFSHLDAITHTLAGYEELVANHLARKAEFEKRQAALKPRLEKAAEPVAEESLQALQSKLAARRVEMEEAGKAQDYEEALDHADYLEAALRTYESRHRGAREEVCAVQEADAGS